MEIGGWSYLGIFAVTLALSLGLTPLALRLALRREVLDRPEVGDHKGHESPVPYLGGLAIVGSFAAVVLVAAIVRPPHSGLSQLALLLGTAFVLSVIGLVDDLRNLGPFVRFAAQIGAGVAAWYADVRVDIFRGDAIDLAITVLWVVGITNAFNLLDNMDGLSAGVAAIAAGGFFLIAAVNGQFLVAGLSVALAGCALGFLRSNFHPARIYMGDAGALFLGFMLAVLGMKLQFDAPRQVTFFVPILVLGVAIFDTTLVTVTRLLHRRSPLRGGRDHTSHRLVFVGVPVPAAVGLIYAAAVSMSWLALITSRVDRGTGFLLMGFVITAALFVGTLLGIVPVYETSTRRRMMLQEVLPREVEPPAAPGPDAPPAGTPDRFAATAEAG